MNMTVPDDAKLRRWLGSCSESTRIGLMGKQVVMPVPEWGINFILPEKPDYMRGGGLILNPLTFLSRPEEGVNWELINIGDKLSEALLRYGWEQSKQLEIDPAWASYVLLTKIDTAKDVPCFTLWSEQCGVSPAWVFVRARYDRARPYRAWAEALNRVFENRCYFVGRFPKRNDDKAGDFCFAVIIDPCFNTDLFREHDKARRKMLA